MQSRRVHVHAFERRSGILFLLLFLGCKSDAPACDALMSWDAGMQIEAIEAASQGDVSKVRRLVGCAANLDPAAAFILSCSELGAGNFAQARAALDELDRLAPTAPEAKLLDRLIAYRDGRPNAGWLSGLLANQGGLGLHIDASPLAQTKATPRWAQTHGPVRDEVAKFVAAARVCAERSHSTASAGMPNSRARSRAYACARLTTPSAL